MKTIELDFAYNLSFVKQLLLSCFLSRDLAVAKRAE